MNRGRILIGLLIALAPSLGAQTADQATKDLIEKLLSRIHSLEKRVAQLESPGAPAALPMTPASPQTVHTAHDQPPIPNAEQPVYPVLKLSGFSDFNFSATNLHGPS